MPSLPSDILSTRKYRLLIGSLVVFMMAVSFINVSLPWYLAAAGLIFAVALVFVLRDPILGIFLIAFFLPFERLGAYEFSDITIRLSQIFLIVTAAAWWLNQIMRKRTSLVRNPIFIALALFLLVNVISLLNSVNLERSLLILIYTIFTVSLAFLIPNIVTSPEQVNKVIKVILVSFVIVSAFGLFQFVGDMSGLPTTITGLRDLYTRDVLGFTRIQSTAYEPLYFANFLLIPLAIIFALFLAGKSLVKSSWLLTLFGLGMVSIVLTVSRGGYLAIAVTLLVISIFYWRKLLRPHIIVTFIVATVLLAWVVIQTLSVGGEVLTIDKFQDHVLNVFYGASFDERISTFDQAYMAWREHPLIGIGVGAFGPYVAPHPAYIPQDGWRIVNNEFIEILAENGIIGLVVFLFFVYLIIIRSIKAISVSSDGNLRAIMVALLAAFFGVMAQYQTFSTLYIMHVWFLIGLMIAVQNIILVRNYK